MAQKKSISPMRNAPASSPQTRQLESRIKTLSYLTYASLIIAIAAIAIGIFALVNALHAQNPTNSTNTSVIFGDTLAGINQPLNSTQLSIINNASDSYFEIAGQMLLNGSLENIIGAQTNITSQYKVDNKTSIIYLGSTTCVFCGENRWAMALALSRFGHFSQLFAGYSALGDHDVPTLYWVRADINSSQVDLGSHYTSSYVNFIAIEDTGPITGAFYLQPLSAIQAQINATGNSTYMGAISKIIANKNFAGTPYTIWGNYTVPGADAEVFGNQQPNSTGILPIVYMTHAQILNQFATPSNQFAWSEYAAADLYIAMTCNSIGNAAPICQLPAIREIEKIPRY